jgi:hypothetical protein
MKKARKAYQKSTKSEYSDAKVIKLEGLGGVESKMNEFD